ncbi:DUF2845 domain-containing protein [Rhodanobacter sp. DHB23]|uniref:DUF2845 domain-containing protein n=1 Tax=Rhodanobacter sp. DHB23 TaxID=2775923 RepID=UPI00177EBF12|nr:DUF2845 domain-containing protein [Rhodanobacter sp. DHB23]MBD8874170.1 DUF2845 domain-containing protein [Rhodanobacter sp. DHB23]
MHRQALAGLLAFTLFVVATGAVASDSLRVGNRVLVVGDSAATVTDLLGKPSHKSRRGGGQGKGRRGKRTRAAPGNAAPGEQWQYRRDGHVVVVTLVDGRVSDIDERSH